MIHSKQYELIIAILFPLMVLATIMEFVFDSYALGIFLTDIRLGFIVVLLIIFMELHYTKSFWLEFIGWLATGSIVVSFLFKIMHWQYSQVIAYLGLIVIVLLFIENYRRIDRFQVLHILLRLFFVFKIISVLHTPFREVLGYIDLILIVLISIMAVYFLVKVNYPNT